MELVVNGEPETVAAGTSVGALVDGLGRGRAGIAVARNGELVPRSAWDGTELGAGDRIEILTAAQGG